MASTLNNTTRDQKFILKEFLDMNKILETDRFKGGYSVEDLDFILDNGLKGAREVVSPSCEDSDKIGCKFENGRVTTPQSSKDAYFFICNNGFAGTNVDPEDDSALPMSVVWALNEYFIAANPSIQTLWLANSGAAGLIRDFGNDQLKKDYLPKMYSGEWAGTMDLTEPQAGSDVGDATTKAIPTDEPGVYLIKGTKCFISGGEQDITDNIIHLCLARIEGAAPGTKGLSLFVVPKYLPDGNGKCGAFNDVHCAGIEHKLGHRGSPTCVINFGEEGKCKGFLLGQPPGEDGAGQGMMQMFKMMNEERLMSGLSGCALAASAYHHAAQYASERIQGRSTTNPKAGRCPIIKHEDVKRMYLMNKATTEACRALLAKGYYYEDIREWSPDPERRKWAVANLDMITPLCKAYPSDEAWILTAESLQSYGGYGYCEDYPAANATRDCKIWSIWEGTNFIQSMDLIGRKWRQNKGQDFAALLKEVADFIAENKGKLEGLDQEMAHLEKALGAYYELQGTILKYATSGKAQLMAVYARRILTATAQLYCGYLLLDQAKIALKRMAELGKDHYDYNFYLGKVMSARWYANNAVPNVWFVTELIKIGDMSVVEAPDEIFDY